MSVLQRILMIAGVLIFLMLMFPPFHVVHPNGGAGGMGYSFFLLPPEHQWGRAKMDVAILLTQWLGVVLIATLAALFYMLESSDRFTKKRHSEVDGTP